MERIFSYTDHEGDLTEFWAESNEDLVIKNTRGLDKKIAAVRMYSSEARRLRDALNYWLGDPAPEAAPVPVYPADSMYGQLIRKAVAEEVARVLPLHLAPMASVEPCQHCQDDGYECRPGDTDPEPHDVGHPVYEDARPHPLDAGPVGATVPVGTSHCPGCDHGWNDHVLGICFGGNGSCACEASQPAPVPVTESDKVWGEQGAPPVACTCEHAAVHHGRLGCGWMGSCTCRWIGTHPLDQS